MAFVSQILAFAHDRGTKIAALGATTASAEQAVGVNCIIVINADTDINIRFGPVGSVPTPDATDYRIPANQQVTLAVPRSNTSFKVFNPTAGASNIYWQKLSTTA